MLPCFRDREDLFVVRCFVCREESALVDPDREIRCGKRLRLVFVCTPCRFKAEHGYDYRDRLVSVPDPQDSADDRFERENPEEAFGPRLGGEMRAWAEAESAKWKPKREGR